MSFCDRKDILKTVTTPTLLKESHDVGHASSFERLDPVDVTKSNSHAVGNPHWSGRMLFNNLCKFSVVIRCIALKISDRPDQHHFRISIYINIWRFLSWAISAVWFPNVIETLNARVMDVVNQRDPTQNG